MIIAVALNVCILFEIARNKSSMNAIVAHRSNDKEVRATTTMTTSEGTTLVPMHSIPYQVDPLFQAEYDRIDNEDLNIKCERYGFTYNSTNTTTIAPNKRRIFFGALVADDNYDVVRAHAIETYGLYHLVSLTESNGTFAATPRELRFAPGTEGFHLLQTGIFGPATAVYVTLLLDDAFGETLMNREFIQRDTVIDAWIKGGMRADDIGIVADVDETFSRDFLLAAQMCDIPVFEPGNDCRICKIVGDTMRYESSPECFSTKHWFHPDMMMGECIMGIGDPTGRILPPRDTNNPTQGARVMEGYGKQGRGLDHFRPEHQTLKRYPLHTATDFRNIPSGDFAKWLAHPNPQTAAGGQVSYVTAYHLHNFFTNIKEIRHKYQTYGHASSEAGSIDLSTQYPEFDLIIRCVKDLPNDVKTDKSRAGMDRIMGTFAELNGNKPIFFLNETYRKERHELVKAMIQDEEKIFGEFYKLNSTI